MRPPNEAANTGDVEKHYGCSVLGACAAWVAE